MPKTIPTSEFSAALDWAQSILGPVEIQADHSKLHSDHESAICRLHAAQGRFYLKIPQSEFHWHAEVHGYEQWAPAFGKLAPCLLAARAEAPLALLVSEIPGRIVEDAPLSPAKQSAIWQTAGAALRPLHELGTGEGFGPCRRDGRLRESHHESTVEHLTGRYEALLVQALKSGYLNPAEEAVARAAREWIPAFAGELPVPCHRDYCAANWLYDTKGAFCGVIDFEFSAWDVRAADFTRDPQWCWVRRPDLMDAFYEGYGLSFTAQVQQQMLFGQAEYALGAVVWGHENAFYGFEWEGREALKHLAKLTTKNSL